MKKTSIQHNKGLVLRNSKGFVILFAVLVSAIILLIGAGIFSISFKETILASMARESQLSINAADAGIECALYQDITVAPLTAGTTINCNNEIIPISSNNEFVLPMSGPSQEGCAIVEFQKTILPGGLDQETQIVSRGFNICNDNGSQWDASWNDPILVERVYRVKYKQPYVSP